MLEAGNSGRFRKRKASSTDTLTPHPLKRNARCGPTTVYDKAFEQHLIDHGMYPYGQEPTYEKEFQNPNNIGQISTQFGRRRLSLSPSCFPHESFDEFERANIRAYTEDDVIATVWPIIFGGVTIPCSRNIEFNNLAPVTDGALSKGKPGYYEGSPPEDVRKHVRDELGDYIIPCTELSRPCLPNFFVEVNGPEGNGRVLLRQACYAGVIGARAMHKIRSYVDDTTALDGNAYTLCWTYDSSSGVLIAYASYPTVSNHPKRAVDYRMIRLHAYVLRDSPDSFRRGVSAFRNARDWAQERRRELIDAANKTRVPASQA
ncbi:MAG: hypothetical protein Q9162_000904 [Coniocarpon cinnabarinum]